MKKHSVIEALKRLPGNLASAAAAALLCIVLPGALFTNAPAMLLGNVDATSSASIAIPDQPSGEYVVLIQSGLHSQTMKEWELFFTEQPVDVIMEDIHCFVDQSDAAGQEMADRYRLRLAENQMKITRENGTLLVSKAENGLFDVIVLSKEMAETQGYEKAIARNDVKTLMIEGTEE